MLHIFLLVMLVLSARAEFYCRDTEKCQCITNGIRKSYEIQCPPRNSGENGIIINVTNDKASIDCYNLTDFVPEMFDNFQELNLKKIEIRYCHIPSSYEKILTKFGKTEDITELDIKYINYISENLTKQHLYGLSNLTQFNLIDTGMIDLDQDIFTSTPKLKAIQLLGNDVQLKSGLFTTIPQLKSLQIAENRNINLPNDLLDGLENLEILHLRSNNLTQIPTDFFKHLKSLKVLELSGNKITMISENLLSTLNNLSNLSLRSNRLSSIPANLLANNPNLQSIRLGFNLLHTLPDYLFSNLTKLVNVDLSHCELVDLPSHLFEDSNQIEIINLEANKLKQLPENMLLGKRKLERLYLGYNRLLIEHKTFAQLERLEILELQNNSLNAIDSKMFHDLINLREINLNRNGIERISKDAFHSCERLEEISLAYNGISRNTSVFNQLLNLRKLDLSHNRITSMLGGFMENKISLQLLNLTFNSIDYILLSDLQTVSNTEIIVDLSNNNISTINFSLIEILVQDNGPRVDFRNNPIKCDCNLTDFIRYQKNENNLFIKAKIKTNINDLACSGPPLLNGKLVKDLRPIDLICSFEELFDSNAYCRDCVCSLRPYDRAFLVDCMDKNLTKIPIFFLPQSSEFNHTEINLQGNRLSQGPTAEMIAFYNVTKLYLSNNNISNLSWIPPKLEVLEIFNNSLKHLSDSVLDSLNSSSSLSSLAMAENPWECNCLTENLISFLLKNVKKVDSNNIKCKNSDTTLVSLSKSDICPNITLTALVLPICILILFIMIIMIVFLKWQEEVKIWLYSKNLLLWWVTEAEIDKDKKYDAFVSYANEDEDFVMDHLVPQLENGTHQYKLCIHKRDWVPGEFITTQICNSVKDSRRTLIILSPRFLESDWALMEFKTAHSQSVEEKHIRVIIIILEDVDNNKLDEDLKAYLRTNTYLKWGEPHFWDKLRYALPHCVKKNLVRNKGKHDNVMKKIDDKFTLVIPNEIRNSESTPPIVVSETNQVDGVSTLLKKHPLNILPLMERNTPPAATGLQQ